jgi:peptidyl-prolyl cis-trans isomerase C
MKKMLGMKHNLVYSLITVVIIALAVTVATAQPKGAKKAPTSAEDEKRRAQVVASYVGGKITVGDVEDAVNKKNPFMRQRYLNSKQLEPLVTEMIRDDLLAKEAEKRGYNKNEEVAYAVKQNEVQTLIKKEFDENLTVDSIPAQDVKKYYDDHIADFVRPAKSRVNYILVSTREEATKLLPDAKKADLRAFREIVRKSSIDEQTKMRGGDLRYFDKNGKVSDGEGTIDPAIVKASFALKDVGDVTSSPVKVNGGFAIIKLSGKREADSRSLKDADSQIRKQLWREKRKQMMDEFVAKLRAEYKPESHPELLDAIKLETETAGKNIPPGFPAGGPRPMPGQPSTPKPQAPGPK